MLLDWVGVRTKRPPRRCCFVCTLFYKWMWPNLRVCVCGAVSGSPLARANTCLHLIIFFPFMPGYFGPMIAWCLQHMFTPKTKYALFQLGIFTPTQQQVREREIERDRYCNCESCNIYKFIRSVYAYRAYLLLWTKVRAFTLSLAHNYTKYEYDGGGNGCTSVQSAVSSVLREADAIPRSGRRKIVVVVVVCTSLGKQLIRA